MAAKQVKQTKFVGVLTEEMKNQGWTKIEELKGEGLVTTADKILVAADAREMTEKEIIEGYEAYKKYQNKPSWILEIEKYCEKEGITPEDLILSHKEARKSKKGTKTPKNEESAANEPGSTKPSRSNWFNDYRKSKTGYSER